MSQDRYQDLINRANTAKKQDRFYVSFFGVDGNINNLLGKYVKSITRPSFQIEETPTTRKGNTYYDPGRPNFSPVTITFMDDDESLCSMILFALFMRQRSNYNPPMQNLIENDNDFKFGVQAKLFNSKNQEAESFILKGCTITGIEPTQQMYSGQEPGEIILTLVYDNIEMKIFDEFVDLIQRSGK